VAVTAPEWAEAKAIEAEAKKEEKKLAKEAEKKAVWRAKLTAKAQKGDNRAKAKLKELLKKEGATAEDKVSFDSSNDEDSEEEGEASGKPKERNPQKVERFLSRLSAIATVAEEDDAALGRLVKMVNKFPAKIGEDCEPLVVEALRRQFVLSSEFAARFTTLMSTPESLGLPEVPTAATLATVLKATEKAEDDSAGDLVVHPGITCDGCNMFPLMGHRFKSMNRPDFDLCEWCKSEDGKYWSKDDFTLIERPCRWRAAGPPRPSGYGFHKLPSRCGGGFGKYMHDDGGLCDRRGCPPPFGGRGLGGRHHHHPVGPHHHHHPPGPPYPPPQHRHPAGPPHPVCPPPPPQPLGFMPPFHTPFFPTAPPVNVDDYAGEKAVKPEARFVQDVTIPEGTELAPGQTALKTWRMRNSGTVKWNSGGGDILMLHVGGDKLTAKSITRVASEAPAPGEELDVTVELVAPEKAGRYVGYFRLAEEGVGKHARFGQRVWASILVPPPKPASSQAGEGGEQMLKEHSTTFAAYTEAAGLKALPEEYQPPEVVNRAEAAYSAFSSANEPDLVPVSVPGPSNVAVGDEWVDVDKAPQH